MSNKQQKVPRHVKKQKDNRMTKRKISQQKQAQMMKIAGEWIKTATTTMYKYLKKGINIIMKQKMLKYIKLNFQSLKIKYLK